MAGVPGAGKTTLIRRAVDRDAVGVVDTDDRREPGLRRADWRGFLYAGHYLRIALAIAVRRPAVIHSRGTRPALRRLIALLAAVRGRSAHLVLIDAERAAAETGQQRRGRTVSRATMDREVAQWRRLMAGGPVRERWRSVTVLDRAQAAQVRSLGFAPAVPRPAAN